MRGKVVKGGKVAARGKFKAEFRLCRGARGARAFLRRQSLHRRDLRLWGEILRRAMNYKTQLIRAVLI